MDLEISAKVPPVAHARMVGTRFVSASATYSGTARAEILNDDILEALIRGDGDAVDGHAANGRAG